MLLYTIGFTKKTAEQFFEGIKYRRIQIMIDIRLNNTSQMAGFTKKKDLSYFLETICGCKYEHCPEIAPTKEILTAWRKKSITWPEYEEQYRALMTERKAVRNFITCYDGVYESVCLLCSEPTPEQCHRRLFAEMIQEHRPEIEVIHI